MTPTAPHLAGRREWIGLGVLALACLLYVMDLTVLHLAVPALSDALRPSSAQLLWIIDIYGFMVAGFLITMGTLGDRIGRRRLLLVGAAAFGLVSVVAAFSTSPEMLIASRALLGIAGATIAPSTLSLIFAMFPDLRQRSVAIGIWISSFSAGSAIGPVLGGLVLEQLWWGAVFLLALPVMGLLLVLGPAVLPEYRDPKAGRLDLVSAGLSLVAVLAVIFGLKQVAQDGPSPGSVAAIVAGLGLGVVWVRRQLASADPMIDLRLFRIPSFSASLVINFLAIFVAIGYFLFVAQYLQLVVGLSPLEAGAWSVPSAIGFVVGSNVAPRLVRRVRPAFIIGGGLATAAAGLAILAQVTAAGGLAAVVAASIVISLGLAPVFGLTTELVVGAAPPERAGAASGMSETFFELGGALGISILGSIGVAIYRAGMADLPAGVPRDVAAAASDTLGAAAGAARQLPGEAADAVLSMARVSFVEGMQAAAWISLIVAIGVALVALVFLRDLRPTGQPSDASDDAAEPGPDRVRRAEASTGAAPSTGLAES
ncbi:MAG: MFS transporter [Chloroflexota bacterium]